MNETIWSIRACAFLLVLYPAWALSRPREHDIPWLWTFCVAYLLAAMAESSFQPNWPWMHVVVALYGLLLTAQRAPRRPLVAVFCSIIFASLYVQIAALYPFSHWHSIPTVIIVAAMQVCLLKGLAMNQELAVLGLTILMYTVLKEVLPTNGSDMDENGIFCLSLVAMTGLDWVHSWAAVVARRQPQLSRI